jgi:glycerol-3-phosphate dehydrogenase (NAD(P)+)
MARIAVIGAGSWGTALAHALSFCGHSIMLWAYEPAVVESIRTQRENAMYLDGVPLPANICSTNDLREAMHRADFLLTVMPSHICRSLYERMLPHLTQTMMLVSATKGIDTERLKRMSEVIQSVVERRWSLPLAVLSGPSFAREVVRGDPTALVVASQDPETAQRVQQEFSGKTLRVYTSDDVVGVELGGAVKNVIAIAAGVIEGLGLGHNPRAALITRGLAEMTRLACACGARRETLAGLAGMGDLVLTCTGALSRNRMVGIELGRGRKLKEILQSMNQVAEGVLTTQAVVALAEKQGIEMPITIQVHRVLQGLVSPRDAIRELMDRSLKNE